VVIISNESTFKTLTKSSYQLYYQSKSLFKSQAIKATKITIQKNTEYSQTHQKTANNQKGQKHINSFNISYTSLHFIYFTF
jgi:hypothetical protein